VGCGGKSQGTEKELSGAEWLGKRLLKCCDARKATTFTHEVSHPVAADRDPFHDQVVHHPAGAAAGILQVVSVDPRHDLQGRFMHRHGPVIKSGSG